MRWKRWETAANCRVAARVVATPTDRVPAWAEVEIADSGPGIRPEVRRHLFDPFFSGREAGRGLGFGLSKAWRVVGLHGGQIVVVSEPGEGAAFIIRLPLADSGQARSSAPSCVILSVIGSGLPRAAPFGPRRRPGTFRQESQGIAGRPIQERWHRP